MIIGKTHQLRVSRTSSDTVWLVHAHSGNDAGAQSIGEQGSDQDADQDTDQSEIRLPLDDAPSAQAGDELTVFVYSDSDSNPVATTQKPLAQVGECASLKVKAVTEMGAFLDWGIEKDLFLPFSEQRRPVQEGAKECVLVFIDNTGRVACSSRIDHHLDETDEGFSAWQQVNLLVYQRTDMGFKAVINNHAIGLLYNDEIFTDLKVGQKVTGYVKRLRQDHRIDLALQPPNNQLKSDLTDELIQYLKEHDGISHITDKSSPELIYDTFGVSKKNFKRALSALYKQRRIIIETDQVLLVSKER